MATEGDAQVLNRLAVLGVATVLAVILLIIVNPSSSGDASDPPPTDVAVPTSAPTVTSAPDDAPTTTPPTTITTSTTFPNLRDCQDAPPPGIVNCPETVAYDMFGPAIGTEDTYTGGADGWSVPWPNHEQNILNDGTNYRWLVGGSASKWNEPGDETAIYARCKVVPAEGGIGSTDFVLEIRGLTSYQRIDGSWFVHQDSDTAGLDGDWFDLADFENGGIDAELVPGSEPGVWRIPWPENGEIFHFFMGKDDLPSGELRKRFDPVFDPTRDAFFATGQVRIVPGEGVDPDDINLLGNCGLDYYLDETSTRRRDYPGRPVPSAGHPRSKLVTDEWQALNWYTLPGTPLQSGEPKTWQELRQDIIDNPPPIDQ